ncbi:MAG: hypothetical protein PVF47_14335, partial [Anaerolineae bacterium]
MRFKAVSVLIVLSMFMLLVAACGPTPEPIIQTVEVEKEVKVVETVQVVETVEVEKEVKVVETVEVPVEVTPVVE